MTASATSPLALVPLARQLLELARKSAGLPPAELQASLMLLAFSDALSKFDGSTAPPSPAPTQQQPPPAQQPSAEAHPPPAPPPAAQAPETVVPSQPAAAPVTPVAEPRAKETPPEDGSTQGEEEETEGLEAVATATTNLNSAKAEAKLVKALDYLVAINDHSDNPGQKWFINESILASLTGCFEAGDKEIR
jgi:outer membrane biosynthesis protein TonB